MSNILLSRIGRFVAVLACVFFTSTATFAQTKGDSLSPQPTRRSQAADTSGVDTGSSDFVLVPGGTYWMGDVKDDRIQNDEKVHRVTVGSFYCARHELTFDAYDAFCTATNRPLLPDEGWGRGQRPVVNVSWYDAVAYCNWRSQQDGRTPAYVVKDTLVTWNVAANGYRLPTEAEWEYAARERGKEVRFGNGKDDARAADINFDASSTSQLRHFESGRCRQQTVPVDDLAANALGLKQMTGNVWEWCWDWYGSAYYFQSSGQTNPVGPPQGEERVLRGGSWNAPVHRCRVTYRDYNPPVRRDLALGFRLVFKAVEGD